MLDNLVLEVRRGVLSLAVLSQLGEEQYGYALMKKLEARSLVIDQGTLYPLLRRLEEKGLLQSEWRMGESRPRRYYIISPFGQEVYSDLKEEWAAIVHAVDGLIKE